MNVDIDVILKVIKATSLNPLREIDLDCRLAEDLNFDSVQMIKLALTLEEKAGVDIFSSDIDVTAIATVRDVVNAIASLPN